MDPKFISDVFILRPDKKFSILGQYQVLDKNRCELFVVKIKGWRRKSFYFYENQQSNKPILTINSEAVGFFAPDRYLIQDVSEGILSKIKIDWSFYAVSPLYNIYDKEGVLMATAGHDKLSLKTIFPSRWPIYFKKWEVGRSSREAILCGDIHN